MASFLKKTRELSGSAKRILLVVLILLEALLTAAAVLYYRAEDPIVMEIPVSDMPVYTQKDIVTEGAGEVTAFDPAQERYGEKEIITCGPYIKLPRGSYDITIHYETDTGGNQFAVYSEKRRFTDALYMEDLCGFLPAGTKEHTSHIRILKDIEKLDVQTWYFGEGTLTVKGVTLRQTNADVVWYVIRLVLLLLLLDLCLWQKKRIVRLFSPENYRYTAAMLLLIAFSCLPLFVNGMYYGHDARFHFNRLEGIKEAMLSGQFPFKMHSTQLYGYGYATGQMYPQFLLYLPAFLRILGFDGIAAHNALVLCVNALTALISFYSFRRMFRERALAFVGAVLYTLAPYRILDLYFRGAVGEYCSMIGLPLIAWGLYSFAADELSDEEPDYIALALGYSITASSHLLSLFCEGFFSLLFGVIFIRRMIKKSRLLALGKALGLTVLFNAAFYIPFIEYARLPMKLYHGYLEEQGIEIAQLFTNVVLQDIDIKMPVMSTTVEQGITNEMPYAIGYGILISTVCFLLLVREDGRKRGLGLTAFGFGALGCLLSLRIFPWDRLTIKLRLHDIFEKIQFPWRFLMFSAVCLTICSLVGVMYLSRKIPRFLALFSIVLISVFGFTNLTDILIEKYSVEDYIKYDPAIIGSDEEYLLEETDKEAILKRGEVITASSEEVEISGYRKLGSRMGFYADNKGNQAEYAELPLLMYPGYAACDESGSRLAVSFGDNQLLRVELPPHFSGEVRVWFAGKWYWRAACLVSFLAAVLVIFLLRKRSITYIKISDSP